MKSCAPVGGHASAGRGAAKHHGQIGMDDRRTSIGAGSNIATGYHLSITLAVCRWRQLMGGNSLISKCVRPNSNARPVCSIR